MSYNNVVAALNVDSILIQMEVLNGGNFYLMIALKSKFIQHSIEWRKIGIRASQISVYSFNSLLRLTKNNALMLSPTGLSRGVLIGGLSSQSANSGERVPCNDVIILSDSQIESYGLPTLTADGIRILPGKRSKGITCQMMNIKVSNFNPTLAYQSVSNDRLQVTSAPDIGPIYSTDLGIKWLISCIISNSRGIPGLNIKSCTGLQTGHRCPAWSVNHSKDSYIDEHLIISKAIVKYIYLNKANDDKCNALYPITNCTTL